MQMAGGVLRDPSQTTSWKSRVEEVSREKVGSRESAVRWGRMSAEMKSELGLGKDKVGQRSSSCETPKR